MHDDDFIDKLLEIEKILDAMPVSKKGRFYFDGEKMMGGEDEACSPTCEPRARLGVGHD